MFELDRAETARRRGCRDVVVDMCRPDPPENCHLNVKKKSKNLPFFFFKWTKIVIFFNKIANGNFFEKNDNLCQFF